MQSLLNVSHLPIFYCSVVLLRASALNLLFSFMQSVKENIAGFVIVIFYIFSSESIIFIMLSQNKKVMMDKDLFRGFWPSG